MKGSLHVAIRGALKAGLFLFLGGFLGVFLITLLDPAAKGQALSLAATRGLGGGIVLGFLGVVAGGPAALLSSYRSDSKSESDDL